MVNVKIQITTQQMIQVVRDMVAFLAAADLRRALGAFQPKDIGSQKQTAR